MNNSRAFEVFLKKIPNEPRVKRSIGICPYFSRSSANTSKVTVNSLKKKFELVLRVYSFSQLIASFINLSIFINEQSKF